MKLDDKLLFQIIDNLTGLTVYESMDFEEFLHRIILIVDKIIPSDSIFIYVYDGKSKNLTLMASKKPKQELLGKIKLKESEGITGWVVSNKKSIAINEKAFEDKRFRVFKELPEDKYEAFLSIPIIGKDNVIGVINLQNKNITKYKKIDISIIESISKIISSGFYQNLLNQKLINLEDELKTNKLVNKAKALLMKEKKISEDQAYRLLQKEAMNRRRPIKDIAQAVIMVFNDFKS